MREFNPQAKPLASFEEFRDIFRNFFVPACGTEDRIDRLIFEVLEDLDDPVLLEQASLTSISTLLSIWASQRTRSSD